MPDVKGPTASDWLMECLERSPATIALACSMTD
jgi:hypothetical protein